MPNMVATVYVQFFASRESRLKHGAYRDTWSAFCCQYWQGPCLHSLRNVGTCRFLHEKDVTVKSRLSCG